MAEQKKRTSDGLFDALNKISEEEGLDFGLDGYTPDSFRQKYFTGPGNIENLYHRLNKISDEEGLDFGQGTVDEWLSSFGYKKNPDRQSEHKYLTLSGKPVGQRKGLVASTVNTDDGMTYTKEGIDSLINGAKPVYTGASSEAESEPTEPIDLSRPQEYELPKPFAQYQEEMQQQVGDPQLSQQWAQRQSEAREQIVNPTKSFEERVDDIQRANEAEAARQQNRQAYDQNNFEPFFEQHVTPVFGEERAAGEQRALEEARSINERDAMQEVPANVAGAMSGIGKAFKTSVAVEKHTDPGKIANATLQRVQDDDAFGDYVLGRMGINGQSGNGDGDSPQLSEREKEFMKQLFAKETSEVASQITQRIYDTYKRQGVPESALEYITGKAFHENMMSSLYDAMVRRVAGSSGMRQQLRAMAYQEYDANWATKVAGGAAPFAVDMLTGAFAMPAAVGQAVAKGGMRMAAKQVAKEMEKRAVSRGLEGAALKEAVSGASGVAERYIATNAPIVNVMLRSIGGASNFATYDVQAELIRQYGNGEFNPVDLMKEAVHGAVIGGLMGATGGMIANATMNKGFVGKLLGDVASIASETGIFAAANGIQQAVDQGIDITDVDWANTTGEALGMVVGMKAAGAAIHPKELVQRYRNSKDLGMQLNQHDLDELQSHGYKLDGIFKGLGEMGKIAPEEANVIRQAKEYTVGPEGTGSKRMTTSQEAYVDADNYNSLLNDPNVSSSLKRKIAYIATGKVLSLEPAFGATIDIDENGKATITTLNAAGNIIDTKDYDNVEEAQKDYQTLQQVTLTNTIGGLERIADKAGFPDVVDEAKGRTKNETGIDVDDMEQLTSVSEEQATNVLKAYTKNLQEAYMERFMGKMVEIEANASRPAGTGGDGRGLHSDGSGLPRSERRQAAYDRGATVADDEGLVSQLGYESQLAEARMTALLPDGERAGFVRQQVQQAMEQGDVESAERILDEQSPHLSAEQREAVEGWLDTFETSYGVDDAIQQQVDSYEQDRRELLQSVSDAQGNITRLLLKDGSYVYLQSGDLNTFRGQLIVTDGPGSEPRQISTSDVTEVGEQYRADELLERDVEAYGEQLRNRYAMLADGRMLAEGQVADIAMGNQLFAVTGMGQDEMGNHILKMPDGSMMGMTTDQLSEAIRTAHEVKIQQQLGEERMAATLSQQRERFGQGIKGYAEGMPDLSHQDTKPDVAAEYLLSQTDADGQPVDRKQAIDGVQGEIDRLNNGQSQMQQVLQQARNDMAMYDEGSEEYRRAEAVVSQLEPQLSDIQSRRRRWGEVRQAMMNDEERQAFEKDRIKEIGKAKTQSKKDVQGNGENAAEVQGGTPVPTVKEMVEQYPERSDGESFVDGQRKRLSDTYKNDVYPKYDDIQKTLEDYQHGLSDLSADELKELTDQQALLELQMSQMVEQQKAWTKLANDLGKEYGKRERQQMTPHELALSRLQGETDKAKKIKLAQEAFKDDPEALAVLENLEPQDVNEYVAANLGKGSINWEGLQRGEHYVRGLRDELGKDKTRGVGSSYDTNPYNQFLAPEGQGKGIDEIVHAISEGSPYDPQDVKNALLGMLSEATKPTDISHYIENSRIADAERIYEQNLERQRELEEEAQREAEDAAIMEMTGMEPEEYDAYISSLEQRLAEQEGYRNSEEYFNNILEYERRAKERSIRGSSETGALGMQGQEGEQAGAEANAEGGAGETAAELTKQEFDKLASSYNGAPMAFVTSSMSERGMAESIFSKDLVDGKSDEEVNTVIVNILKSVKDGVASYVPELGKIIIFADRIKPGRVKEAFFHENIHALLDDIYQDGLREVADVFWELTPESFGSTTKEFIKKKYDETNQKEEFFTYSLSRAIVDGNIENLLKVFDNDRQRETGEREEGLAEGLEGRDEDTPELLLGRGRQVVDQILDAINPITASKSGTIAEFLERNADYKKGDGENAAEVQEPAAEDTSFPARLAAAKEEVNTEPTEEQKKAGNYKMGHISFGGYQMSIENPKGSTRSGVDKSGKPWSIQMQDTYGYIGKKYGTDGDHLDFFINDDADLDSWNGRVYVVDQKNEDGTFDEHKVMYGYPTFAAAKRAYMRNYEDGWWDKHVMQMTGTRKESFDKWLAESDHKRKPFADYSRTRSSAPVKDNVDQLLADVEDRQQLAGSKSVIPVYKEADLAGKSADELRQLRKKAQADKSLAKVMLGTTDAIKGTDKERTLQDNIVRSEVNIDTIDKLLQKMQNDAASRISEREIGGAMVEQLELMGFGVTTNKAEMRRVRKQAEGDNSEAGKMRHMRTSDGKVYGFTYQGKMYLDPTKIDGNLPMHEYAHPWCAAFRKLNPEGWKNIVDLMKGDKDTWDFVKQLNPDLTDESDIAEEMIAIGSGKAGQERIRAEYERMNAKDPDYKSKWGNIWQNISKAIQDFWKQVGDFLHIKYESAEQVYDQVVKDFVNRMNPRARVEKFLKERDAAYMDAVNRGDNEQASAIFDEALRENVGNGITPFVAVGGYRGKMQKLAHAIKERDPKVIAEVADLMAPLIPKDAVLVPAPSHTGRATDMLDLAQAISERTGAPVADVLTSAERGSQYDAKKAGKPMSADELGIVAAAEQLPADKMPVVIDNVVDTGNTAEACVKALGKGIVCALGDSSDRYKHAASLKSAEPIVTDKKGEVVPLSERFTLGGSKWLEKKAAGDGENAAEVQEPGTMAGEAGSEPVAVQDVSSLLKEVDRRKEVAKDKKDAEDIVKKYLESRSKSENEAVAKRATKAVLKAMDNAGVPYKVVSKAEEKEMLKVFSMMNQEAIKELARRPSIRSMSAHGRGSYIIYNMSDPFGVPMYFEKQSTAKYAMKGLKQMAPDGDWEMMYIGSANDVAETQQQTRRKAAEYNELMQMMGWDKKMSAPATALGDDSPLKDAVVTESDFAKVQNNLETLAKNTEKISNEEKNRFISLLSKAVGAQKHGSNSQYVTIEAKNGTVVTLRLADHNVTVSDFDYSGKTNGVSIVISRKPNTGIVNDGNAHIVEYFYPDKELRKAEGSPYSEIVKSVEQMLYSGEYKDTTGIARPKEVNKPTSLQADIEVWHGSGAVFTKFDHSHMGEGAGSQVFGWGTYVSDGRMVAEGYARPQIRDVNTYSLYTDDKKWLDDNDSYEKWLGNIKERTENAIEYMQKLVDSAHEDNVKQFYEEEIAKAKEKLTKPYYEREYAKVKSYFDKKYGTQMLYKVDIPDDNGENYLDWMKTIKKPLRRKIADAVRQLDGEPNQSTVYANYKNGWQSLADMIEREQWAYKEIRDRLLQAFGGKLADEEKVSKLMSDAGFVGVKYPAGTIMGGGNGATNYVIFNEDDAKIVQSISFMWGAMFQKEGKKLLGWSDGRQVYLTKDGLNPNTPLHETTHLWDNWCKQEQPELWKKLVAAMKKTAMWEEIAGNPNYRNIWNDENRMASEVHARLSGAAGEDEFMKAAFKKDTPQRIINEVKSALRKFWEAVLRLFGKHSKTVGDDWSSLDAIVRMPIRDLVGQDFEKVIKVAGENASGMHGGKPEAMFAGEKGAAALDKAEESRPQLAEKSKAIFDAAMKLFGTTYDIREAGYVLPDGSMLDFSGRHQMDPGKDTSFLRGRRSVDHREVSSIAYEKDGNTKTGVETTMPEFIKSGAIRIDDNAGSINLAVKPTDKQRAALRQLIAHNDGYVQVDFGDSWDSDHYVEYDGAKPARVLADIDRYFDEGIKPQGDEGLMRSKGKSKKRYANIEEVQKAEEFVEESLQGKHTNQRLEIILPQSTQRMIRSKFGRDYDSHNIYANGIVHSRKMHGKNGEKITTNSIPLRDEDFKLAPYIMTAPDRVGRGSMGTDGRESIRFEKTLGNGYVVVVEKEQKNSPDDMDTITMWAELSSGGADARKKTSPVYTSQPANVAKTSGASANAVTVISSIDAAKIRKDAETAIENDKKMREQLQKSMKDAAEQAGEALGGVKVNAVTGEEIESQGDASAYEKLHRENEDGTLGYYDPNTGEVTLLLDNIEDVDEAVRTVFHEKLGHEGLVALLGSQDAVNKFGTFVFRSAGKTLRKRILDKADENDGMWEDGARYSKAAQEVLADIAAAGPATEEEFTLWDKVKHYIIRACKAIGLKVRGLLNDHDLRYYVLKTDEALKKWNQMSEEERAAVAQQETRHDIMRSRRGKPRKRNDESMAQYFQRLREWEKWRAAVQRARDNGDPEPEEQTFHEQAEAEYRDAMREWREENGIAEGETFAREIPRRRDGESPQEFAIRVAEYETRKDLWATAPSLMDYLRRANEQYRAAYTAWRERYDLQEEASVDQRLYEGDVDVNPTYTDADMEAEALAEKDLAEAAGFEVDEAAAKRMAKLGVIERRKNMESSNAEDAIWIYDFVKESNEVASKLPGNATGKELRAALPFLIEADRRRDNMDAEKQDAVQAVNMSNAVQQAHTFVDYYNLEHIGDELNALNEAWNRKSAEPSTESERAYYDAAARLAEKLNSLNEGSAGYNKLFADDIMQIRSLLTTASEAGGGEVMPEWAKKYEGVPEVEQLMEHIKEWYDEFYQVLEDAGLRGDAGYIEDGYVNHVWDKEKSDPKAWEKYVENRQRTKSPNMRHREIDTYMDGISIGLVPKYTDIADMIAHYSRQNNEAVANRRFLDDLKFVYVQEMNDAGEVTAILPILMMDKPDAMLRDRYAQYYVPGVGDVYVMKHIQKRFANVFGTMRTPDAADWLSNIAKGYDLVSSTAKKIQLALSGFHALALFEVDVAQNNPVKALKHLLKYIITDSIKSGTLPAYAHPEDFQLAAKHLVQLGATEDYAAADVNAITQKIRDAFKEWSMSDESWKKAAGTVGSPAAIMMDWVNKCFDTVLWNYLHDGLKLCAFKELAKQVDRRVAENPQLTEKEAEKLRDQLLDEAGQYVNDMFGGQYFELMNISPATLKWMRRFFLSPDWLISTQRHFFANFGFGSVYSDGGFREYIKYNADNIKRLLGKDVPQNELRRLRSKNAKYCYMVGAVIWWGLFYNAINALCRWNDEEDEKAKAEEERKTNPSYKSPYELAYPDGMKWYDYTMYGNAIGQQTHLYTGRYSDGTETYVRWGKQFREFPELFMGRHGAEFPAPLIQRMMSKANPNIGTVIDFLGAQNIGGFNGSYENKELREKYGKTVATLASTARHFIPFGMPTQAEKEYKWLDFFMPSSKGFSRWKAKDYFETFILDGDWNGIEATYKACVMNGIDAEANLNAAISSIKATQKKELSDGVTDLTTATEKFDASTDPKERALYLNKIKKHLKASEYKVFTKEEALEKVRDFMDGTDVAEKENARYIMLATSADVIAEEKLRDLGRKAKQFKKELEAKHDSPEYEQMKERYGSWLKIGKLVNKAVRSINKSKKQLGGVKEDSIMSSIRETIKNTQEDIDKLQAVK